MADGTTTLPGKAISSKEIAKPKKYYRRTSYRRSSYRRSSYRRSSYRRSSYRRSSYRRSSYRRSSYRRTARINFRTTVRETTANSKRNPRSYTISSS